MYSKPIPVIYLLVDVRCPLKTNVTRSGETSDFS